MNIRIGIRREDKNEWETRVPLTPDQVKQLVGKGVEVLLQPSPIRIYPDHEYRMAGAQVSEDLSSCQVVLAVKEIPLELLQQHKTYVYFSHVIKGQDYNMPMLRQLLDLGCTLFDYELITDDEGRRLVFFGRHAGLAGMIDSLWALGKRLKSEGFETPFGQIRRAHKYNSLADAKGHITEVGRLIQRDGLPAELTPLVCGFAGYGNVSQGAQEIIDLLPCDEVLPDEVATIEDDGPQRDRLFKVVFHEEHLVRPRDLEQVFELQDYYDHPEKYESRFEQYLPYLSLLTNCIYWDPRYPRLVTKEYLKHSSADDKSPKLRVIGDISCDIEGSIECTEKVTEPGEPVYVYEPSTDRVIDGWEGNGPVIMAVDNLPCELAHESSDFFGQVLLPFVPALAAADYSQPLDKLKLPPEMRRAIVVHQGKLTPDFEYLQEYLNDSAT